MKKSLLSIRLMALFCLSLSIIFLSSGIIQSQSSSETDEQVRQLFKEVREHIDKSEFKAAYQKCEQALRLNPESSLLRFMRDELGEKYLTTMLSTPELRQSALRLMELSKGVLRPLAMSTDQIKSLVTVLDTDSFTKKYETIDKLVAVGQRACSYLIENLGDAQNERIRANSLHCLERMRNESVLPLIEALNSKNKLTRQNAAIALGAIKDERAVAELKRLMETEESPEIKNYAIDAIYKITGLPPENLPSAKECYFKLAEKYYYSHPSVMINPYGTYIVWRWDRTEDKLNSREVPEFSFNEELAEEACYDALTLDENYETVFPLLICVYLAEYNEGEIGLTIFRQQASRGEIDEDTLTKLQSDLALATKQGTLFGAAGTRKYLYQALNRSLNDKNVFVSVSCIDALAECALPEDLPLDPKANSSKKSTEAENKQKIGAPIIKALSDDDKRVRYATAEFLMKVASRYHFVDESKVIPVITEALGESGVRIVLIIDEREEIRAQLKKELVKLNCFPIEAMTAQDGLQRAKKFPAEDLIIINSKLANQVVFSVVSPLGTKIAETVFDSFKRDMRTKAVPILLLTDPANIETVRSIFKENAQGYLTIPMEITMLENEINNAFSSEEAQKDSKSQAEAIAQSAASSLASLNLVNCVLPYSTAIDPLISVLEGRPDKIRIPAMKALGRFGDRRAVTPLTKIFANLENKKETRIAACLAIADLFKITGDSMLTETYEILRNGLGENDLELRYAIASIFGTAKLTSQQRREVLETMRLHPK
jgi:HEAT repeat protein